MKMENKVLFSIFYCQWRNEKYKITAAPIAKTSRATKTSIRSLINGLSTLLIKAESRCHKTTNAETAGKTKTTTINKFMVYLVLKNFQQNN